MAILVVADIFSREIANSGIAWAQKMGVYLMIWAGFIGASLTASKGAHLRPEIADKLWPESKQELFTRVRNFGTFLFCFFSAYYSYLYVSESLEMGDSNPILNLKLWTVQLIIPITFLLMAFKSLIFTIFPELLPKPERAH